MQNWGQLLEEDFPTVKNANSPPELMAKINMRKKKNGGKST